MKSSPKQVLLLVALSLSWGHYSQALPIFNNDEVTRQEITTPPDTASMDDYLLDLARAAHVNVIADSTDFAVGAPVQPYPSSPAARAGQQGADKAEWQPNLFNLMGDFAAQEKLSTLRTDTRTFLFWSEPEPTSLFAAQLALTQAAEAERLAEVRTLAKAQGVPEADVLPDQLPPDQLRQVLSTYLQGAYHWTSNVANRTNAVNLSAKIEDLPPYVRVLLLRNLRDRLINWQDYEKLQDSFWQKTDLILRVQGVGEQQTLNLTFSLLDKNGKTKQYTNTLLKLSDLTQATAPPADATPQEIATTPPVVQPEEAVAQGDAQAAFLKTYSGIRDDAREPALEANAALQKPVSLHVKRVALRDLLAQLQEQSGVSFALDATAPATRLITAHVEAMPLARFMGVLTRTYGVTWQQAGAGYAMRGTDRGALHLQLLRVGDRYHYRIGFRWRYSAERDKERIALGRALLQGAGMEALQKPEGVPVTSLPQPLQNQLRRVKIASLIETDVTLLYETNQMLAEQLVKKGLVLRFGISRVRSYRAPYSGFGSNESADTLRFNVQSEDGSLILPVFDGVTTHVAKPGEQDPRPPDRRRIR